MSSEVQQFFVFADDRQTYGPADVVLLREWAQQGLISSECWIYSVDANAWSKASDVPAVSGCLAVPAAAPEPAKESSGLKGSQLRRIRLFSDMTDDQAEKFVGLVEKVKVRAFQKIVNQGEHGDSMFLILDGEARVYVNASGKENDIATLRVGDFFGEMALLDAGPRSASVNANRDCVLLKLSKENLDKFIHEYPDLASRFLLAMNRLLSTRLRQTNDRFTKAQMFASGVSGQVKSPSGMKWNP
jgi:hypothetical protein